MIFVDVHLIGREDYAHQLRVDSAIAFQVADSLDGDSARGDYGGVFPGAVRPLLKWTTRYTPELPR
jgi:lipopolysaccharide transport system ATP-binding protein